MKKILISIVILLLLVLGYFVIWDGSVQLGDLKIPGIKEIEERNSNLDNTISNITELATKTYEDKVKTLNADVKQLQEQKKKYDNLTAVSSENTQIASQYQKYEIEYLWTIIGNHATKEGVVIKMDLVSGGTTGLYNLNFTVTGEYIGIADFISDIENDSALGFKIESFYMVPDASTEKLKATFTCKEIAIKDISSSTRNIQTINNNTTETKTTNTTESNTTNTTETNVTNSSATASGTTSAEKTNKSKSTTEDDNYSEEDFMNDLKNESY